MGWFEFWRSKALLLSDRVCHYRDCPATLPSSITSLPYTRPVHQWTFRKLQTGRRKRTPSCHRPVLVAHWMPPYRLSLPSYLFQLYPFRCGRSPTFFWCSPVSQSWGSPDLMTGRISQKITDRASYPTLVRELFIGYSYNQTIFYSILFYSRARVGYLRLCWDYRKITDLVIGYTIKTFQRPHYCYKSAKTLSKASLAVCLTISLSP